MKNSNVAVKGLSKITTEEIIAMRTLKFKEPTLSAHAIQNRLGLTLSPVAIGRSLRGLIHADVDMCGLTVQEYNHSPQVAGHIAKKEARKAVRAAKTPIAPVVAPVVAKATKVLPKVAKVAKVAPKVASRRLRDPGPKVAKVAKS